LPKDGVNSHHIISKQEWKDLKAKHQLGSGERRVGNINRQAPLPIFIHDNLHFIFDHLNAMDAYETAPNILKAIAAGHPPKTLKNMDGMKLIIETFGTNSIDVIRAKLRWLIYFYLFAKWAKKSVLYTPEELTADGFKILKRIHAKHVLKSRHKTHAWKILLDAAEPDQVSIEQLRWIYHSILPFS
jgi:hypothetical protein